MIHLEGESNSKYHLNQTGDNGTGRRLSLPNSLSNHFGEISFNVRDFSVSA
jgi:hypothetical protein